MLGRSRAEGVFQDFTGRVRRRFAIALNGRMENGALVLSEDFLFDDGATEQRVWRITPVGENGYIASADDMIGEAQGDVRGGVLRWSYLFLLKLGSRRLRVRFHDTFIQTADDTLLNVARVTKFGLELGRSIIIFRRDA
ncbi:MAG: DUF3833 domain-containing protein [Hyphomonadaceae bacterium]|nr:DUF3833 domain-containing protein [Hyphomonadaceae bacterium]